MKVCTYIVTKAYSHVVWYIFHMQEGGCIQISGTSAMYFERVHRHDKHGLNAFARKAKAL